MSDRSIQNDEGSAINVFSLFRGNNRYGQLDDNDDMMSHSPPLHDFPEPMKVHPRKGKFHTLHEESSEESKGAGDVSKLLPSLDGQFQNIVVPQPLHSTAAESSKAAVFPMYRRGSVADALFRAGTETDTGPFNALKLFERSKQVSTTESKPGPLPRMARRASDTNLLRSFAGPLLKKDDSTIAKKMQGTVETKEPASVEGPKVVKAPVEVKAAESFKDVPDAPGPVAAFSGWLFGGAKKVDVRNKDINVFTPTSY